MSELLAVDPAVDLVADEPVGEVLVLVAAGASPPADEPWTEPADKQESRRRLTNAPVTAWIRLRNALGYGPGRLSDRGRRKILDRLGPRSVRADLGRGRKSTLDVR